MILKQGTCANCSLEIGPISPLIQYFIKNRSALIKVAMSIIRCRFKAEDIVQDAFFRLDSARLSKLSEKSQLSYIVRTVRNLAIDSYRKQIFERRHTDPEKDMDIEQLESSSPENLYQCQQVLELITEALDKAPERTRYAFEMHRIHGVQQREIAQQLGVSPTLVNFMIRDAFICCRQAIETGRSSGRTKCSTKDLCTRCKGTT